MSTGALLALQCANACYPQSYGTGSQLICAGASAVARGGRPSVATGGISGSFEEAGAAPVGSGGTFSPPLGAASFLRVVHAQPAVPNASWQLDGEPAFSAQSFSRVSTSTAVPPGPHRIRVSVAGRHVATADFVAPEGGELLALLVPDSENGSKLLVLTRLPRSSDGATLQLIQASSLSTVEADVGADDAKSPDFALARGEAGPTSGAAMDPTRPSLALVENGRTTASFTLPRPATGDFLAAVLLGDPNRPTEAGDSLRLLLVDEKSATVVKPDPVVYVLHAAAAHAGLDVFVTRGNALPDVQAGIGPGCSLDMRANQPVNLAQLVDDLRFGELAERRLPPGAAAFQVFLTIPGDTDPPASLHFDLVANLVSNQRLRDGFPVGCAGAQIDEGGQLMPGAEYLMLLPSGRLMKENRGLYSGIRSVTEKVGEAEVTRLRTPPDAPRVPLARISRAPLAGSEFELTIAVDGPLGVVDNLSIELPSQGFTLNAEVFSSAAGRWAQSETLRLPAARQEISLVLGNRGRRTVVVNPSAGSRLLVLAAGYVDPPASSPVANPRADDVDADGFVASAVDPDTGALKAPNYLPADGNSTLTQDDCPNEPGPVFGCPAPRFTWLVLDTTTRAPVLQQLQQ